MLSAHDRERHMMFAKLRTRIVFFYAALLGLVQLLAFVLINAANTTNAQQKIDAELLTGERVFARLIDQKFERLIEAARVLAADFALREAIATNDTRTVQSALANHGARIKADRMMLFSLDGHVVADTLGALEPNEEFVFQALLEDARINGTSSSIELVGEHAYQFVIVPVLAPTPIARVVLGFVVDKGLVRDLKQLTALDVSFVARDGGNTLSMLATTLDTAMANSLLTELHKDINVARFGMDDQEQQLKIISLEPPALKQRRSAHVAAVLQRSVAAATAVFDKLQTTLLALGIGSLLISLFGSAVIARNITKPLDVLADSAARIQGGDYTTPVALERNDEIGALAGGLDQMREGIAVREQEIMRLAYEDSLTGLPNRALFNKWLNDACRGGGTATIIVMDIDRFKAVNDTLGHGVGDHVLREVAQRLRKFTADDGTVARLGGDEFAILFNTGAANSTLRKAQQLYELFDEPIPYQEQRLDVRASMGVATYPDHGSDASMLLRHADIAMYVAKRSKSGYALYDPQHDTHRQEHLTMLGDLRRAVENDELQLYFQPKISIATDEIGEVEALLRWQHPTRGFVPPAEFIPFAEQTGYIKVLTQWVLKEVVRQAGEWLQFGMPLRVSINVSTRDLLDRDLLTTLSDLLAKYQTPADLICVEITESGVMEDPGAARKMMQQLHRLGVHLSIDDYGTGYSSLSYIAQLPVDELKIDRSFVANLATDSVSAAIVRSTIELGHNLGLKVVAEGVENLEAFNALKELNCDSVQGFYFSKPVTASKLESWLQEMAHKRARKVQRLGQPSDDAWVA
jgi:diguanylate cyclase (GGDEF)-like protein